MPRMQSRLAWLAMQVAPTRLKPLTNKNNNKKETNGWTRLDPPHCAL